MTRRAHDTDWRQWSQLALLLGLAGFVLLGLWLGLPSWRGLSRAVAQTTDPGQIEPLPSEPDAAVDEAPDRPTDHLPVEARRRHVGANAVWMQESDVPPPVPEASVLAPVAAPAPGPVDEATAKRVRGLLEQYERVRQALPQSPPSTEGLESLAGPPRMDSGDPDPDRLQAPPAHPANAR